jgi:hypothetical protein
LPRVHAGIKSQLLARGSVEAIVPNCITATVSEQLGHASAAFTLDIYSDVLPHMQVEAAAKMEAALMNSLSL